MGSSYWRWIVFTLAIATVSVIAGCGKSQDTDNPSIVGGGPGGSVPPGGTGGSGGGAGGSGAGSFSVTVTDPPDGAVGVQLTDPIGAAFSDSVNTGTVSSLSFRVLDDTGTPVSGIVSAGGRTATFTPSTNALVRSTQYTATLTTSIKNSSGAALANDVIWHFTTSTDAWAATVVSASAASARFDHTAVWTGSEMIVWGGTNSLGLAATGARYDPLSTAADPWTAMTNVSAPLPRSDHTAIWTGSEMIVWGGNTAAGFTNTGGRYVPSPGAGAWKATPNTSGLLARRLHSAIWTGSDMIVWGGDTTLGPTGTGARYRPATDQWTLISNSDAPLPRFAHTAVWTGSEMIVWGGDPSGLAFTNTGGRYRPATNDWVSVMTTAAPSARAGHTAIWTGNEMIVWGGTTDGVVPLNDGARYDPATDSWRPMADAPIARSGHEAVWTGTEMLVWGGDNGSNSGAAYNPAHDTWRLLATSDASTARTRHTAVWTGSEMIVWGGTNAMATNTGGRYTP